MEGMKHYGWGIVDKYDDPCRGIFYTDKGKASCAVSYWNADKKLNEPFRVAELFYKDERS